MTQFDSFHDSALAIADRADAQAPPAKLAVTNNDLCALAHEHYRQRVQAGETVDPEEFSARYPACESSLLRILVAEEYFEQAPGALPEAAALPERAALPVAEAPDWPAPGEDLLGFHLLGELGRGAFARVYLARQPSLGGRLVVLKVSPFSANEAQTLGRLEHPNIVAVHSVGEVPGRGLSLLCMPYLGRATLCDVRDLAFAGAQPPRGADAFRAALAHRAIPGRAGAAPAAAGGPVTATSYVDAVIDVARQLAEALAFVHARGVCHLDLKPSNVLLGPDGRPMLLDFNLCDDPHVPNERHGGTLPYMSPEQLRSMAVAGDVAPKLDGRSDLYSLGVILYELLTGQHPFGALSPLLPPATCLRLLLARQTRGGMRPLRRLNPHVDGALERVIARCLAFDPAERFDSAAELAAALKRCQAPSRRAVRWGKNHPAFLNALLLLSLAATVGWGYQAQQPSYASRQQQAGMTAYAEKEYRKAIDALSNAIDQPSAPVGAYYYRGQAYLHLGPPDYAHAADDFRRAAEIAGADPDAKDDYGKAVASAAYCFGQLSVRDALRSDEYLRNSKDYAEKAIRAGCAKAIAYNNLGFLQADRAGLSETALKCFDEAIELDNKLQAAFHNRARIDLKKAASDYGKKGYVPEQGMRDVAEAIQLGPASPELYYDAFCLYAYSSQNDSRNRADFERAKAEIRRLVKRGWLTRQMADDPFFKNLRARLGVEIREGELKDRSELPIPRLFLDPAGE